MTPKPPKTPPAPSAVDQQLADIQAQFAAMKNAPTSKLNYLGQPAGDATPIINPDIQTQGMASPGGIARDAKGQPLPRYYAGAENWPAKTDMSPDQISKLQDQLVQAGQLDSGFQRGVWDDGSATALGKIMASANNTGSDWPTALQHFMDSEPMIIDKKTGLARKRLPGESASGATRAPLSLRLSNPDDLASVANDAAMKRLGRTFTQEELNKFVTSYHSAETGTQTADYNAQAAGGSATATPTSATAANKFAEQVDPVAAQARNVLPLVASIDQFLKSGGAMSNAQAGG